MPSTVSAMGRTAIRLAFFCVRSCRQKETGDGTHVFDIGARVDSNHITVLDSQVVADDSVDSGAAVVELLVGEDDQNSVLPLLAADQNGITTEKLEGIHGGLGQSNDAVVIVDGIGDPGIRQYKKYSSCVATPTSAGWASSSS